MRFDVQMDANFSISTLRVLSRILFLPVMFYGELSVLARPTHARSFHSGIDGESSGGDHAICFYENSDSEDIILDLSSFDDVDSQHESVLLLLGNV